MTKQIPLLGIYLRKAIIQKTHVHNMFMQHCLQSQDMEITLNVHQQMNG